ncbi:hypothetical protein M2316_002345, partial [Cellulosimicrobium cellulans]|nr:hypothetical protein [Cellulosimicrobium cellulans]
MSGRNPPTVNQTDSGKVERFQATMKKWLTAQPVQPATLPARQTLL